MYDPGTRVVKINVSVPFDDRFASFRAIGRSDRMGG